MGLLIYPFPAVLRLSKSKLLGSRVLLLLLLVGKKRRRDPYCKWLWTRRRVEEDSGLRMPRSHERECPCAVTASRQRRALNEGYLLRRCCLLGSRAATAPVSDFLSACRSYSLEVGTLHKPLQSHAVPPFFHPEAHDDAHRRRQLVGDLCTVTVRCSSDDTTVLGVGFHNFSGSEQARPCLIN